MRGGATLPDGPELERLLETAEIAMYRDLYEAIPAGLARKLGLEANGNGCELWLTARCFDHPLFNRVMGVGLSRPSRQALSGAARHFKRVGIRRWMLQVLPHVEVEEFRAECAATGLIRHRGWAKHLGPATVQPPGRTDLKVERIDGDLSAAWARLVVETFDMDRRFIPWFQELAGRDRWRLYVALDGDTPVAAAASFLWSAESEQGAGGAGSFVLAQLNFAGTLESHRGRGAQSALAARRIADVRALGAEWIVTETDEELPDRPNPSYRNMVRLGLPVRYVRANWGPPKPSS